MVGGSRMVLVILVGVALVLGGCASGAPEPSEVGVEIPGPEVIARSLQAYPHRILSNDEQYGVAFRFEPKTIPLNEPFIIEAWVFEGAEWLQPATDVALVGDAAMPQHRHGMLVRPTVAARGVGRFRIEGMLFHMPGAWELYFDMTRGATTERAQCAIELE